ncbi:MAG: FprA family A-type flavoprotein [Anaerolineaceae bacterium]|nr:FprA family A-type flavoprotein [Anaerolineaceae bacterium]
MQPLEICPDIFWIGANDRTTDLFEGLWPIIEEGVSYNSYLIKDEKNVVIDLTKEFLSSDILDKVHELITLEKLDFVVINHMEPDHSGAIKTLIRLVPDVKILGTKKTAKFLDTFFGIKENVIIVEDGETLNLGKHTLKFIYTPNVHWPETMMTYELVTETLFSCDAFGGYGALRGSIFEDQYNDLDFYIKESLRYYVNIISMYNKPVLKAIEKLAQTNISMVAPSHGLIWRTKPETIVKLYKKWAEYGGQPGENGVTLVYGSMYGSTEKMMNAVAQGVASQNIPLNIFDVTKTHESYIMPSIWVNKGVLIGAPTYESSLFPPMANFLNMISMKRMKNKNAARFGSYGWFGGAQKHFESLIAPLNWDLMETLEFVGSPTNDDLKNGEKFGQDFARFITE